MQLDGLRGLFALMVALFHFPYEGDFENIPLLSNFMIRQGDLFVDFFFVLSGFVISLNYHTKITDGTSFRHYLLHRFLRLYPLLFYTVIVYFGFELIFNLFLPALLANPEPVSQLVLQTLNSLLFLNSTPVINMPGMNFPSWSISSEMISYIVFGITAVYFGRKVNFANGVILLISALFLFFIHSYMETYYWGFVRGIVCFMTGYYTFKLYQRYHTVKIAPFFEYCIPVLLVSIFYIRFYYIANVELFSLIVIPAFFGTSIFIFSLSSGYLVTLMSGKALQFLGKISYSLYLNHAIIMVIITKFIFSLLKITVTQSHVLFTIVAYLVLLIIYSYLTYLFIEIKGRKLLQNSILFKSQKKLFTLKKINHYKE